MRQLATLVVIVIALSGCVQTQATMLSSQQYAPQQPENVTIYLSEDDIPGRFDRIALINAKGNTQYTNQNQMYEAVRKRAASIGANGVLFAKIDEPSMGAKIAGAFLGTGSNRQSEMVAIYVYLDEEAEEELELEEDLDSDGEEEDSDG